MWYRLVLVVFFLLPGISSAAEINAGFVNGLWYSDDTIFAEETVRVYVAIRNNTDADLAGTVTFFDNDKKIGTQSVAALNGRIIESWVDWMPTYGEHTVKAELSRLKLSAVGSETENVDVTLAAATDTIFVDYDTDDDNTGNNTDSDDDGDNISDVEESENKTNPLVKNKADSSEGNVDQAVPTTSNTESVVTPTVIDAGSGGLERFLTPSRADTLLTHVTTWSDDVKKKVDDYRTKRKEASYESTPSVMVDSDGFGEITRSNAEEQYKESKAAEQSIISSIINLIGNLLGGILTAILATVSWTLGYSSFIQLLLLVGILLMLYFVAKKMGSRPIQKKKK